MESKWWPGETLSAFFWYFWLRWGSDCALSCSTTGFFVVTEDMDPFLFRFRDAAESSESVGSLLRTVGSALTSFAGAFRTGGRPFLSGLGVGICASSSVEVMSNTSRLRAGSVVALGIGGARFEAFGVCSCMSSMDGTSKISRSRDGCAVAFGSVRFDGITLLDLIGF